MSDTYYREQATRRARIYWVLGGIILISACSIFTVTSGLRDTCTGNFDRTPASVVESYIDGIRTGNIDRLINCWAHNIYYEVEAGCSEICLSRILGTQFEIVDIQLSQLQVTQEGRANITATVTLACPSDGEQHTGEILLDGIQNDVPWRHWKIISSSVGGPLSDPWCQE